MANIATITNNVISALSGTTSQVLLGDATLTDFKLDSLTDVSVPTPGDGDVLRWNASTSLWEASDAAGLTGSGTTNYLPKFTGASTLGNSLVYDNGTNVGIGTASPSAGIKLQVDGAVFVNRSGNVNYVLNSASSHYGFIQNDAGNKWSLSSGTSLTSGLGTAALTWFSTGNVSIGNLSDNGLRFQVTGDGYFSGSVGIGVSPSVKLQVNNEIATTYSSANTLAGGVIAYIKNTSTTNSTDATIRLEATGSGDVAAASISAIHAGGGFSSLTFGTRASSSNVTERMRLDFAGNLGLGVVPSAWAAGYKALQVLNLSLFGTSSLDLNLGSNVYYDGVSYKYIANGFASLYNQYLGKHYWNTAPSGTAGNAITFTQAMTLDASGNLGIGTTNPLYTFHAVSSSGTIGAFRNSGAALGQLLVGNTAGDLQIRILATGDGFIFSDTGKYLALGSSGLERIRITSTGNVGIGTTNPTSKLVVVEGGVSGAPLMSFIGNAGNGNYMRTNWQTSTLSNLAFLNVEGNTSIDFGAAVNMPLNLYTNNAIVMTLTNGNVGINTTTPVGRLDVVGTLVTARFFQTGSLSLIGTDTTASAQTVLTLSTGVDNATGPNIVLSKSRTQSNGTIVGGDVLGTIQFQGGNGTSSVESSRIQALSADVFSSTSRPSDLLFFTTAASTTTVTERMRIRANGNVGIGDTGPSSKLQVNGDIRIGGAGSAIDGYSGGFFDFASGVFRIRAQENTGGAIAFMTAANGASNTSTEKMRITSTGSVWVGAISAAYQNGLLTVGNLSADATLGIVSAGSTYLNQINFGDGGFGDKVQIVANSSAEFYIQTRASGTGSLTEKMRITSAGNVGIGTSAPFGILHVNGGDSYFGAEANIATNVIFRRNGATRGSIGTYNSQLEFSGGASLGAGHMVIASAGNVGIGTSAPAYKLHVAGNLYVNHNDAPIATFVRSGGTDTNTVIAFGNATTTTYFGTNGTLFGMGGSTGSIPNQPFIIVPSATEKMRIDANGYVGIGTSSPNALFTIDSGEPRFRMNRSGVNHIIINHDGTTAVLRTESATPLDLGTSGATRMTISSGGNVGIGTTTPAYKLDVVGTSRFDGTQRIINSNNLRFTKFSIDSTTFADIWFSSTTDSLQISSVTNSIKIGGGNPTVFTEYIGIASGGATTFSADATINGVRVGKGPNSLSGNTVLGTTPLNAITTGTNNVSIGTNTLRNTTTGSYNIAIGTSAGGIGAAENTTGSLNIFIGAECQGQAATDSNRTWIGGPTTTSTWLAGRLLLGSKSDDGVNRLQVTGSATFSTTVTFNGSTTYNAGAVIRSDNGTATAPSISFDSDLNTGIYRISNDILGIATGGAEQFRITGTGATFSSSVTAGGLISATTEFRLNTNTFQRIAKSDGSGGFAGGYNLDYSSGGVVTHAETGAICGIRYETGGNTLFFNNTSQAAATSGTERMRITNTGNLLIGGTSDTTERLQVTGTMKVTGASTFGGNLNLPNSGEYYLQNAASTTFIGLNFDTPYIRFAVGNTVRAVMTTTGLGLGTNSPAYRLDVQGTLGVTGAATFSSSVTVNGSATFSSNINKPITTKTAAYTLTDSDYTVVGNTNLSAFTFTLPTAVGRTGRIYAIKNAVGGNTLTVDGNGSETIDGYLTYGLSCQSGIIIQSDGANWYIIADIADTSCFVTP